MSNPERWKRFPPLPPDIEASIVKLSLLFVQSDVQLAYLFGSLGRGRTGQDVDLALLTEHTPVYELRSQIREILGTERLDLIDLKRTSPVVRFEIISTGQLIYAVSDAVENRFELDTIHLYRDTAPQRRRQEAYLRERMSAWSSNAKSSQNA